MNSIPLQNGLENWKPTNSSHIERWLGKEKVEEISKNMRDFYWPVAIHGVPGYVYGMPGGDFAGKILCGSEMSAYDRAMDSVRRYEKEQIAKIAQHRIGSDLSLRSRMDKRHHSFASLSAIITAATGGKMQNLNFSKTGVASNAIGNANDLWTRAGQPVAGAAGGAAPGGTVPTNASTGALGYVNPSSANTGHLTTANITASVVNNTLLLYDRLFAVAKTMNSTVTEVVSGVPTRYTNTTVGSTDYIGGNYVFPANPTTVLAATAHNWNGLYTDQDGNAAVVLPTTAGVSACVVGGVDIVASTPGWFLPLASGDTGIKALTAMTCSALVATGTIDFVIGHPIAFFPCPIANMICTFDGINTAFNLQFIFDNACLSFMEMPKPATTATTYSGIITTVSE
ncbi:hypothetical protein [Caudoviricetes sp.]|nr:hypothetical protein [Caudoviricetes sp.]